MPQGKHVHLLDGPRRPDELERGVPRPARRHGRRGRPRSWRTGPTASPFGAAGHLLGTKRHAARRVHRLRPEPAAPGVADPQARPGDPQRGRWCASGVAEPLYEPAEERVTGVRLVRRRRRATSPRRPGRRRDGARHPPAGVAGAVGVRPAGGGHRRRRHQVRHPPGPRRPMACSRRGSLTRVCARSREKPVGLGMLLYEDGLWGLTTFGTERSNRRTTSRECASLADDILPTYVGVAPAPGRTDRRRGVPRLPDQPLAPVRQDGTASPPASSRSATRWSASTRRSARA